MLSKGERIGKHYKMTETNKTTKLLYKLLIGTGLSILTFFSISFVTVLLQINSPLHRQTDCSLDIGFPSVYYKQFIVDLPIPNSGWTLDKLFIDIIFTWLIVTGLYILLTKKKARKHNAKLE